MPSIHSIEVWAESELCSRHAQFQHQCMKAGSAMLSWNYRLCGTVDASPTFIGDFAWPMPQPLLPNSLNWGALTK